jgi:hypothetical protein
VSAILIVLDEVAAVLEDSWKALDDEAAGE